MDIFFRGAFWGALIIFLGIALLLNIAFGIHIPVFRVFLALFLVSLGISVLVGRSGRHRRGQSRVFEEGNIETVRPNDKYDVVFSRMSIDLTGVELKDEVFKVNVDAVFGSVVIRVNPAMPVKVVGSSVFGTVQMPKGNSVAFGESTYRSDSLADRKAYLLVKVDALFSSVEVLPSAKRPAAPVDSSQKSI